MSVRVCERTTPFDGPSRARDREDEWVCMCVWRIDFVSEFVKTKWSTLKQARGPMHCACVCVWTHMCVRYYSVGGGWTAVSIADVGVMIERERFTCSGEVVGLLYSLVLIERERADICMQAEIESSLICIGQVSRYPIRLSPDWISHTSVTGWISEWSSQWVRQGLSETIISLNNLNQPTRAWATVFPPFILETVYMTVYIYISVFWYAKVPAHSTHFNTHRLPKRAKT